MAYLVTETTFASLTGTGETLTLTELAVAIQTITVGDSAGLIESARALAPGAPAVSDTATLTEYAPVVSLQDADTPSFADAPSATAGLTSADVWALAELATATSGTGFVISSNEAGTIGESVTAVLSAIPNEATAMAEAINRLLSSLSDVDTVSLAESAGGGQFGLGNFQGLAVGFASVGPNLFGTASDAANLVGTANVV